MRRVLLDTHALIWWLQDADQLGKKTRLIIEDPRNQVVVSAASLWEMSIKQAKGLLSVDDDLESIVVDEGFTALPIALFHAQQAGRLPFIHKDPFDRMLIAQAQAEGCELVTADSVIPRYGLRVLNARI